MNPRLDYPKEAQVIERTGSVIHWDRIESRMTTEGFLSPYVPVTCGVCQLTQWRRANLAMRSLKAKFGTGYCYACQRKLKFDMRTPGKHHGFVPKRKPTNQGYVYVKVGNQHPMAQKKGDCLEHRLVMSRIIGRPLTDKEVVHHENGLRTDNRPENLVLLSSHSEHGRYHKLLNRLRKDGQLP